MSLKLCILLGTAALTLALTGCTPTREATEAAQQPEATAPALPVAPAPVVPAVPAQEAAAAQHQQKVTALVRQVEAAYARGEANYRKGKLPEAKIEFDRAVDLMLASGFDIRNEPKLQEEFDHVVDGVNALEMEVLKQGNGFVGKEEETPAQAASDITFVVDPAILAKAKANLATTKSDLPLVVNDYVASYINFFANTKRGHYTLLHSFQRGGRYKAMIQRVMAEEGVPQDLIYLAVAESGFNPRAVGPMTRSGGRAGGMWQFMPNDKFYGLARTAYVDERFDPEKSTRAYARYMKFIYDQLGDWYLAMAGYNWGTRSVQNAVQKTGYNDFWELYRRNNLPVETRNYVPEILAAIIVANHPEQYGFDEITLDPPVLTDTVTINYSVDLHLVSDIVKAPMEEMVALNPSMLRTITPPDTSFDLHLPAGTAALFEKEIVRVPEAKRTAWRYRRLKEGDTLASVARDYHVSQADLAAANELEESAPLTGVEALVVPATQTASAKAHSAGYLTYTTRKGDTLVTIADRFGVPLDQLRSLNKISGTSTKVEAGRKLKVGDAVSAPRASRKGRHARNTAPAAETDTHEKKSSRAHGKKGSSAKEAAEKPSEPASTKRGGRHHAAKSSAEAKKPTTAAKKEAPAGEKKHSRSTKGKAELKKK